MTPFIATKHMIASASVLACITATSCSTAGRQVTELRKKDAEKLALLSQESQKYKPACKAFNAEVAALGVKGLDGTSDTDDRSLATRAELDSLVALISRYPGTPAPAQQMMRGFLNYTLSYGTSLSVKDGLSTGIAEMYPCDVIGFWSAVKIVLNTSNRLKLPTSEKHKIGRVILERIQYELASPLFLMNLVIQSMSAEQLVREKFVVMSDASYVAILALLDDSEEFRTELRKTFAEFHDHPTQISKELRGATRLGTRLSRLLSRI